MTVSLFDEQERARVLVRKALHAVLTEAGIEAKSARPIEKMRRNQLKFITRALFFVISLFTALVLIRYLAAGSRRERTNTLQDRERGNLCLGQEKGISSEDAVSAVRKAISRKDTKWLSLYGCKRFLDIQSLLCSCLLRCEQKLC